MTTIIRILSALVIFTLVFPTGSRAQQQWTYGLNGGFNLSWVQAEVLSGEPLTGDFGSRFSWNAGFYAEHGLNNKIFFQAGFNIDQRGFTYNEMEEHRSVDLTVKAPYLEIPLLFRYVLTTNENFAIYSLAGPSFTFLLGGRVVGEKTYYDEVNKINSKLTDSHQATDLGVKLGLGVEIPVVDNLGATFIDIRYNWGITDHIRQGGYYHSSNLDANSHVISFIIGVRGYVE